MKYFVPDIQLPNEPQSQYQDKLGGQPWGLPLEKWPKCQQCGKSQSLLAQFKHDPVRLDLGKDGRVLFVFMCCQNTGFCSEWDGSAGATSCFVMEPEDLISGLTQKDVPVQKEVRIINWIEKEDGIPASKANAFFNVDTFFELGEELFSKASYSTRFGSVPDWLVYPEEGPGNEWRFIGQLVSFYSFYTPPLVEKKECRLLQKLLPFLFTEEQSIKIDPDQYDGCTHWMDGIILGDRGTGYIFLEKTKSLPKGYFFWQGFQIRNLSKARRLYFMARFWAKQKFEQLLSGLCTQKSNG